MSLSALVLSLVIGQAAPAGPLEVNEQNFDALREKIRAKGPDIGYRELTWQTDLTKMPAEGARRNGPWIFWLADGDPRSRTDSYGVMSRRMVFSDPMVISQARGFALYLGDIGAVQRRSSWLSQNLKNEFAKNKSGLYAIAPRGKVLGFTASTSASDVSKWLNDMLASWAGLAGVERRWTEEMQAVAKLLPPQIQSPQTQGRQGRAGRNGALTEVRSTGPRTADEVATPPQGRPGQEVTIDGTVVPIVQKNNAAAVAASELKLRVTMRDLPREAPFLWSDLYNMDAFTMSPTKIDQIMIKNPRAGDVLNWPTELVRELATATLNDNVRGHSLFYTPADVQVARMTTKVHSTYANNVLMRFYGNIAASAQGSWALEPGKAPALDEQQVRGTDLSVYGRAIYDVAQKKFLQFDLVLVGKRWGGSPLNMRVQDLKSQPIGIMFTTAGQAWYDDVSPNVATEPMGR